MPAQNSAPLDNRKKLQLWLLLLVIPVGVLSYVLVRKNAPVTDGKNNASVSSGSTVNGTTIATSAYKNGTYTVDASYNSPGGPENFELNVTLADGMVTASDMTAPSKHPTSLYFQQAVRDNYKQYVVGKNIADVAVSKISGASLTSRAFNRALDQVRAQAKS